MKALKRAFIMLVAMVMLGSMTAMAAEKTFTIKHMVKLPTTQCAKCHKVDADNGLVTIKSNITGKTVISHFDTKSCAACHQVKDKEVTLKKAAKADPSK